MKNFIILLSTLLLSGSVFGQKRKDNIKLALVGYLSRMQDSLNQKNASLFVLKIETGNDLVVHDFSFFYLCDNDVKFLSVKNKFSGFDVSDLLGGAKIESTGMQQLIVPYVLKKVRLATKDIDQQFTRSDFEKSFLLVQRAIEAKSTLTKPIIVYREETIY